LPFLVSGYLLLFVVVVSFCTFCCRLLKLVPLSTIFSTNIAFCRHIGFAAGGFASCLLCMRHLHFNILSSESDMQKPQRDS